MEFAGTERFSVVRRLGEGGMGVVYEVLDREKDAAVALKLLRKLAPTAILRFKTEFRSLQGLMHENLVSLGELFEEQRQWFFTMELIPGQDFLSFAGASECAATHGSEQRGVCPVTDGETVSWERDEIVTKKAHRYDVDRLRLGLLQLAQGLTRLHAANKVHRDVKPSNIRVTPSGRVVLLDFGLVTEAGWPQEHGVWGTVPYMAPEQIEGAVTPAADWYSVGTLLYQALTGRLPFRGMPSEMLAAKREHQRPVRPSAIAPNVPQDLETLCLELLSPCPEERPTGEAVVSRLSAHQPAARTWSTHYVPTTSSFIGRESELRFLQECFTEVRQGQGVPVFVHGESGVGKSNLIQRWLETLRRDAEDVVILEGRCFERELIRYKAVDGIIDSLARYLLARPAEEVIAVLPRRADFLIQAFAVLGQVEAFAKAPKSPHSPTDALRQRSQTFEALRELFARLAERKHLVLVVDDLQWADPDSVALLSELMRPPEAPSLMFVALSRSSEGKGIELEGALENVRRLRVGPLTRTDAQALVNSLLGQREPNERLAGEIAAEAGGHPLFIQELVHHFRRLGSASIQGVRLEDAIESRLMQLEPIGRQILRLISIAGAPIEQTVIANAAGIPLGYFCKQVSHLRHIHLLKTAGPLALDTVEPYHDRIRETVLGSLEPVIGTICYRNLAAAAEASGRASAENLAMYWLGAGEKEKAADYAVLAAAQASAALAVDRAVRLYRMALELRTEIGTPSAQLQFDLAQALVNAGRGLEAAQVFLSVAPRLEEARAVDARRRAADQLLRYGHIQEGLLVIDDVLASIGMKMPRGQYGAMVSLLWNRLKLKIRGHRHRLHPASEIPQNELHAIDVYQSISVGLAIVDPLRASLFQAKALLLALHAGEPDRLAQAFAMEAMLHGAERPGRHNRQKELLANARALADSPGRHYSLAFVDLMEGLCAQLGGHFLEALEFLDRATTQFRERCPGSIWELDLSEFFSARTLALLGDFREMRHRLRDHLRHTQTSGSVQAATYKQTFISNFLALTNGDVSLARQVAIAGMSAPEFKPMQSHFEPTSATRLPRIPFDVGRQNALYSLIQTELFAGNALEAYSKLEHYWPFLKKSSLLRIDPINVFMKDLRARCAIALAAHESERREELLTKAHRLARRIERTPAHPAPGFAAELFAQVAYLRGNNSDALTWLDVAQVQSKRSNMAFRLNAAKWMKGLVLGGEEGRALVTSAREWMILQEIVNPERMFATFFPVQSKPFGDEAR